MSKLKCKVVKKAQFAGSGPVKKFSAGDPVTEFTMIDNGGGSFTLLGRSAAGNDVDISGVATVDVVSADPTLVTASAAGGADFNLAAVGPVTPTPVDITATATWNDGSLGPFSATLHATVVAGPAGSVVIELKA